jgi:hypothetical protein
MWWAYIHGGAYIRGGGAYIRMFTVICSSESYGNLFGWDRI